MSGDRTADMARLADMLVRCGIERGRLGHLDAYNLARVLMPTVDAIADERARQRAAEALQPFEELFSGGPDTACRTTWHGAVDCVEVPMFDLREAFVAADAAALRGTP